MFGVEAANKAVNAIAVHAAEQVVKKVARQALTKGTIYPIVKKVAVTLGFRMTKEVFAKGVSKIVPVIGAVTSGALTYATYRPMAYRLKDHLASLQIADINYYGATPVKPTGTVKNQSIEVIADHAIQNTGKAIGHMASTVAKSGADAANHVTENAKKAADTAAPIVNKSMAHASSAINGLFSGLRKRSSAVDSDDENQSSQDE